MNFAIFENSSAVFQIWLKILVKIELLKGLAMRNPNVAYFNDESLADELLRHFKRRAYQRQEKSKDLMQILRPLMRVPKEFASAMPKSAYAKALKVKRPSKQVVIKNIGNLKLNHLQSSLNYVITNSKKSAQDEIDNSHLANALNYATSSAISVIDENGNIIDSSQSILDSWREDLKNQKANANLAWHLAFSIDEPVSDENSLDSAPNKSTIKSVILNKATYRNESRKDFSKSHGDIE